MEIILKIINNFKPKTNYGTDSISNKLIKSTIDIIANPLTIIINQVIQTGIFPDSLNENF